MPQLFIFVQFNTVIVLYFSSTTAASYGNSVLVCHNQSWLILCKQLSNHLLHPFVAQVEGAGKLTGYRRFKPQFRLHDSGQPFIGPKNEGLSLFLYYKIWTIFTWLSQPFPNSVKRSDIFHIHCQLPHISRPALSYWVSSILQTDVQT